MAKATGAISGDREGDTDTVSWKNSGRTYGISVEAVSVERVNIEYHG